MSRLPLLLLLTLLFPFAARAEEDAAPPPGPHLSVGLGLNLVFLPGTQQTYYGTTRNPVGTVFDGALDLALELESLRLGVELGYGLVSVRGGLRGDWIFGVPDTGWHPFVGASASIAGSGRDLGDYTARMLLAEGGLAWRKQGHTRVMFTLRAGGSLYTDGQALTGYDHDSLRPAAGAMVEFLFF
ncbi:MAG: hypothetical protein JST92_24910 [Deltaproteobacteria bacterium]|nr:hypothetical protein [Deltaproteobacteria bacterium]